MTATVGSSEKSFQRKSGLGLVEDVEIGHVVELVVAASEALVIDELSREGCLAGLTPENILEAALCVKRARQEFLVDCFCCQSDELDQIDSLSDLDDTIMLEAFEDAGLSLLDCENGHVCDLLTFVVNDTLESENHDLQLLPQDEKSFDDISLGISNSYVSCSFNAAVHDPSVEAPNVSPLMKPEEHSTCPQACTSESYEGHGILHYGASNRFRSCWLGGRAAKGTESSLNIKQRIDRLIPQPFVGQTSFLSESADIAQNVNSFLLSDGEKKVASQLSVNFEGIVNFEEGTFISQETRCSNPFLSDPLCSVVPCSIPSDTAVRHFVHDQSGVYGNSNVPVSQPWMENVTAPDVNVASKLVERKYELFVGNARKILEGPIHVASTPVDSNARSCNDNAIEDPVRRHVSSLRIYSTEVANPRSTEDGGKFSLRTFAPELKASSDFLLLAESNCLVNNKLEEHRKSCAIEFPLKEMNVPAKEGAKMNHASLPALNSGISSSVQGSKLFLDTVIGPCKRRDQNRVQAVAEETRMVQSRTNNLLKRTLKANNSTIVENLTRKRVRFADCEINLQQKNELKNPPSSKKANEKSKCPHPRSAYQTDGWKSSFGGPVHDSKGLIFHGVEFLLTGFSSHKERAIMKMIQEHGGIVLSEIPVPMTSREHRLLRSHLHQLPIVISSKKVQTTKFLYGCAVNTLILKLKWLTNSIAEGSMLNPEKYMILPHRTCLMNTRTNKLLSDANHKCIFEKVGILLHGTRKFYTKYSTIMKHGGGQVFKTFDRLFHNLDAKTISVGAIVTEDNSRALRQLKHFASERNIPMMPGSWIGKSLLLGRVLPFGEDMNVASPKKKPDVTIPSDWCQEI